jgi:geranylgeranyl transferase type-2 subunit beta
MDFLALLRDDIRAGLLHAPDQYRRLHARWMLARQLPGGAFANRRGKPDLYYTAFALRGLSALQALHSETATVAAAYLKSLLAQPESLKLRQPSGAFSDAVAAASWWDSVGLCEENAAPLLSEADRAEALRLTHLRLAALRRDDGGWAKTDMDGAGSLYHSLIACSIHFRTGVGIPQPGAVLGLLKTLARDEGGFLENRHAKRPGTNGCAAGVFLSLLMGNVEGIERHGRFLKSMQGAEGGFLATQGSPIADLLSTYSALFTLKLMSQLEAGMVAKAGKFGRDLEQGSGGYVGFALETLADCEYAFYGLGVESICRAPLNSGQG